MSYEKVTAEISFYIIYIFVIKRIAFGVMSIRKASKVNVMRNTVGL
jgi:hypothetical protein